MLLDCPHLLLTPAWAGDDDQRIVLVEALEALALCHQGDYESVAAWAAIWELGRARESLTWEIASFLSRVHGPDFASPWASEHHRVELIVQAIERGDLVALRRRQSTTAEQEPTRVQRRLVRDIESRTRGRLSDGGRNYKLVAGVDLAGLPDRDSYEVASHIEGTRVLGALAKDAAPDLAALFAKAGEALAPDWRRPNLPRGLVCLRRNPARRVASASPEPAFTPSQLLRQAKEKDDIIDWTIWIELDPSDPKANDDVVILLDEFYQEVMRKALAACPREGTGVLVTFEKVNKHDRFTLIRDYGPDEGGGQDTLFMDSTPAGLDEKGSQAS